MIRFARIAAFALAAILVGSGSVFAQAESSDQDRPEWLPFNEAVTEATESGKMVVIDIWSASCGWCRKMQNEVYTDPELLDYLNQHFVTGRLDIDIQDDKISYMGYDLSSAELSVGFGASGTPTTIFLTSDGSYITRLPGFHNTEDYLRVLRFIGTESFREMSFEEYVAQANG